MQETAEPISVNVNVDDTSGPGLMDRVLGLGHARAILLGAVWVMIGMGIVMALSTCMASLRSGGPFEQGRFMRHLLWVGLALAGMMISSGIGTARLYRYRWAIFALAIVCLVAVLLPLERVIPGIETERNGARRWIRYGSIGFQPSELGKLASILVAAAFLTRSSIAVRSFTRTLLPMLLLIGLVSGLILAAPDMGTSTLVAIVLGAMMVFAGVRLAHLAPFALAGIGLFVWAIKMAPYRMARVTVFLDPGSHRGTAEGYQVWQSLIGLGSGGIFGVGPGAGRQKYGFLPEADTDFVYAIIGEEFGLIGTLLVLAVLLVLIWQGLRIAVNARSAFASALAFGLTALIGLQSLINIAVVTSSVPTKGIPLPFISYGGSSMLMMACAVGVLAGIAREAGEAP